jgi:molecular chaperone GrpE (heat shock protein)
MGISYKSLYLEEVEKNKILSEKYDLLYGEFEKLKALEDETDDKYNMLLGQLSANKSEIEIKLTKELEELKVKYNELEIILNDKNDYIKHLSEIISNLREQLQNETPSNIYAGVRYKNGKFWRDGIAYSSIDELKRAITN